MRNLIYWKSRLETLAEEELDTVRLMVDVRRRQQSPVHRVEITRMLDDENAQNWMDDEGVVKLLDTLDEDEALAVLNHLIALGELEEARGVFVEKDLRGRDVEVAIAGRTAIYYHIDPTTDEIRVLRLLRVEPAPASKAPTLRRFLPRQLNRAV